jgi:hypothetical protein
MPIDAASPRKNRQRREAELLRDMQQAQREWREATGEERVAARSRFIAALQLFNSVALCGKDPPDRTQNGVK